MAVVASPGRPSRHQESNYNGDSPRKRRKQNAIPTTWSQLAEIPPPHPPQRRPGPGRPRLSRPVGRPRTIGRPRRNPLQLPPTRTSTSAEAAAAVQSDGYKPREERGWEEFHPDLDVDAALAIFTADEVDGVSADDKQHPADSTPTELAALQAAAAILSTPPPKRRPGRPPRRPENMLFGLGSPTPPRITPLPAQNPRERLNLPRPSYKRINTFAEFEADRANTINYVDRQMAAVGFQESEMYLRADKSMIRLYESREDDDPEPNLVLENDAVEPLPNGTPGRVSRVEYDMDEQDQQWLDAINVYRKHDQTEPIKPAIFEITMTQIEKEWHALEKRIPKPNPKPPQTQRPRSSSAAAVNGEPAAGEEQDSKCAICDDGDCENTNAIVFCDGCDLAVHQECYGVPFIPEGQWLCRKCQFIGRNIPTCIFCPNTEGAFKLTTQQKWVHLLCSIWVPEVSISNSTFMEPIDGVQMVPKNRWKLICYICHQRMGACIQCANRSCFAAFHVTCARRAKLYLKMKSSHGGPAVLDASVLKALCDKHVPPEWRQQHDVEAATMEAKAYYRRTLKGRRWADSATSALSQTSVAQTSIAIESVEENIIADGTSAEGKESAAQRRNKILAMQKNVWRLPSGAPIVPQVVFTAVECALIKFSVRKRKEFVAEACKYWTLKREARRGAALLKRLQLQMETFSTTEITRRNFSTMGASGGPKLQRRIRFADQLLKELEKIRNICQQVKEREINKANDVRMMANTIDSIYFPVIALLWPILRKAESHDSKDVFARGFKALHKKLDQRQYTSAAAFSADLGAIFKNVSLQHGHDSESAVNTDGPATAAHASGPTIDDKEVKRLAKRIIKGVQPLLQDAMRKEAELSGKPFEKEIEKLDLILNGVETRTTEDITGLTPTSPKSSPDGDKHAAKTNGVIRVNGSQAVPPTPPGSEKSLMPTLDAGGIPWYLEPFDIDGTTVHDERWSGREVLRDMSEPLSELDEEQLADLGGAEVEKQQQQQPNGKRNPPPTKKGRAIRKARGRRS